MPRPVICRRVWFQPGTTYFKPAGVRMAGLIDTVLTVDEFEAIRLKDFEEIDQIEAAKKMNISQPTFNRLLRSARKKIADAVVNGKAIRIQGGVYKMVQRPIQPGMGRGRRAGRGFGGPAMNCVCPKCGYKEQKQRGIPCANMKCPKCRSPMIRRG